MAEGRDVVVVTGASGLLGWSLVERLRHYYDVVGLDVERRPSWPEGLTFVETDITDENAVGAALAEVRDRHGDHLASVVHLVAYYDFTGAEHPGYHDVTVEGTRRLLRLLRAGFTVEQFVFSSTMLVHRPVVPGERISERSPLEATWSYPASKIEAERVIAEERGPIPSAILRVAGVYDEEGHSPPLTDQIRRIAEGQLVSHFYPGPLDRGQDFVHLDDVIGAFARTVARRAALPEETFLLVGTGRTYGYGEVQDAVGRALGKGRWRTFRVPQLPARLGAAVINRLSPAEGSLATPFFVAQAGYHYALDVTSTEQLLEWAPTHDLLEDIPAMVAHMEEDPAAWYRENGLGDR